MAPVVVDACEYDTVPNTKNEQVISESTSAIDLKAQIRRIAILHALGAMLFITASGCIGYLLYRQADQIGWVNHTYEVRDQITDVLWAVKSVESASRGFVASRDHIFVSDIHDYVTKARKGLDNLVPLTEDNPSQVQNLAKLKSLVEEKIDFNTKLIVPSVEHQQFDTARAQLKDLRGLELMREIQRVSAAMKSAEDTLLVHRQKQVHETLLLVCSSSVVLIFVAFVTLLISFKSSREFFIARAAKEKLALEAEYNQKHIAEQLARSNRDLQQFAYVASHDLQEPLRAVGGFLTLIASKYSGQLGEQGDRWIGQAVEGAERMRTLINDLLAFARIESGGGALKEVDSGELLARALKNLETAVAESGAIVEHGSMPHLVADSAQLVQLFQNLIGNSIKYRSEKTPVIKISATPKDECFEYCVEDNGMGFDMAHAERIFVIFQRLHSRTEHPGTGIGLALCSRIVERLGGKIWALSEPGRGSQFYFTIPRELAIKDPNEIS
ncbi:MAG: hypothetical protein QG625_1766 [Cyanobacteriota bacterium erpe_2018_sw_39hr_WHONDRS-SW48-000098_B_bin.30]|nr:hypothetical protein [Cyanobacteriota bacterium erpe_2018_sw_39hr_WHONDRS-SW48-000098_B_bin.30]